jgi:hypothetical protein
MNGASQQQLNQGTKAGIIIQFSFLAGCVPALYLFAKKVFCRAGRFAGAEKESPKVSRINKSGGHFLHSA